MVSSENISAIEFWNAFTNASSVHLSAKGLTGWSNLIFSTLHDVQKQFGLWCQCKGHPDLSDGSPGERLKVDFLWFPRDRHRLSADEAEWIAPTVAIEHENLWASRERDIDHWKVSQVATPLRVFIGYTATSKEVDAAASRLQNRESRWHAIKNGESAIILGHGAMSLLTEFRGWWAPQGSSGRWQSLAGSPNGA